MISKEKSVPDALWANALCALNGLISKNPVRVFKNEFGIYWPKNNHFCVSQPGFDRRGTILVYASDSLADVGLWTQGVKDAMGFLAKWSKNGRDN